MTSQERVTDHTVGAAADAFLDSIYRSSGRYAHWSIHVRVAAFLACSQWEWMLVDSAAYRHLHSRIHAAGAVYGSR